MSAKKETRWPRKRAATAKGFTVEEKAAVRARARELRATKDKADGGRALLEAIAAMGEPDRALAEGVHALITATTTELAPRTWYGMPAYARDDKVVCFFKPAEKFRTRYATLGFSDKANLDDGAMWPTEFALKELTSPVEKAIAALLKRALR
jgi:uncharacterized protein YdhG (YjbR/CyaY superfamily)